MACALILLETLGLLLDDDEEPYEPELTSSSSETTQVAPKIHVLSRKEKLHKKQRKMLLERFKNKSFSAGVKRLKSCHKKFPTRKYVRRKSLAENYIVISEDDSLIPPQILSSNELNVSRKTRRTARPGLNHYSAFDLPPEQFKKLFKLPKEDVIKLCSQLREVMPAYKRATAITPEAKVLAALRFYAMGGYQKNVGRDLKINISQPSVSRCVMTISKAASEKLYSENVCFPFDDEEKLQLITDKFSELTHFPGIIGVVGFTHISIVSPPYSTEKKKDNLLYYNQQKYHSLNVLLVCDANMKILHANTTFPGAFGDSDNWYNSDLRKKLEELYFGGKRNSWLIGTPSLPLEPWLLTPFRSFCSDSAEESYNQSLGAASAIMKNCSQRLKRVFGCLQKINTLYYSPEMASSIINTCIILHNILIDLKVANSEENSDEDEVYVNDDEDEMEQALHEILENEDDMYSVDGYVMRQELVNQYFARRYY